MIKEATVPIIIRYNFGVLQSTSSILFQKIYSTGDAMNWLKTTKDYVLHWSKNIPTVFKKTGVDSDIVEVDDLSDDTEIENGINTERLAIKLSKHLPDLHSLMEENAETQELKDTLERLQADFTDETKRAVLQALSEDDTKTASDLLKKLALSHANKEEHLTELTANDWIDIGNISFLNDSKKALSAYRKAIKQEPSNTDAWIRLGRVLYWQGNYDTARQAYEKVLKLAADNKVLQAVGYGNLGTIYKVCGELDKAEEFYLKSFKINGVLGRQADMALAYGNLGVIYCIRGEYGKAEEQYLKSLRINKTLGRQEGIANQYCNLGIVYKNFREFEKAEEQYLKSLEIFKILNRDEGIASSYANLGIVYNIQGKLDKAEEFHLKSLEINNSLKRNKGIASDYGNIGNVYKSRGELDEACEYWNKSLELFSEINANEQVRMTKKLIADNCQKGDKDKLRET